MNCKILKMIEPDAPALRQAREDEAIVTGQPIAERIYWFENTETGQKYYDLFGCIGWPTENTEAIKGMPGYVAVIGVVKDDRPAKQAWFRLMGEGESDHISVLLSHVLRLRSEFGFGQHPGLLQTFFGDPDQHIMSMALLNEQLIERHGEDAAILIAPPTDFYYPDVFNLYRRSFNEAIQVVPERLAFGGNERLKAHHRENRTDDPAILAAGGLVYKLIVEKPWFEQIRENIFNVED